MVVSQVCELALSARDIFLELLDLKLERPDAFFGQLDVVDLDDQKLHSCCSS